LWRGPFAHGLEEYIEAQDRIHPDRFVGFLAQRARWIEYVWVFAWLLIGVLSMFALPFIIRLVEWPR
jgi:hypothetical protein